MKSWPLEKVNNLLTLEYGKSLPDKAREKGMVPVVGSNGIVGFHNKALISGPAIVVGRKGTAGRVNWIAEDCFPIDTTYWVKITQPEKLNLRYAYYALKTLKLEEKSAGTVPGLNRNDAYTKQIPLPPINIQLEIATNLDKVLGLQIKRKEADQKMATVAYALFRQMFGDPGKNEMGLIFKNLAEVSRVSSGAGFPLIHQGKSNEEIPFFKVGDMNAEGNLVQLCRANHYISKKTAKVLRAEIFPAGAVVFPKIGAAIGTNKKRILAQPSCVDNNVMVVIPTEQVLSEYLFALFQTKHISDFASIGTVPSIRKSALESWAIPVPPILLQKQFVERIAEVRILQEKQSTQKRMLAHAHDCLIQDLL